VYAKCRPGLNAFYYPKTRKNDCSKCSAFASFALLHLFFTSNSVIFVDGEGAQKYFLPQGAGYPSYATALEEVHEAKAIEQRASKQE